MSATVCYEVNITLDSAIEADYRAWLAAHVAQMLALPGFMSARVLDVRDPVPADGHVALCVQYWLTDAAALQDYFDQHAARLRGDGMARFGGRFSATRRVLQAHLHSGAPLP